MKGKVVTITMNDQGSISGVYGALEFIIYDCMARPMNKTEIENCRSNIRFVSGDNETQIWREDGQDHKAFEGLIRYCHLSNIAINHFLLPRTSFTDIIAEEDKEVDIKYSALIDNANVSTFEDVTLDLNTFNPEMCNKLSYSYLMDQSGNYVGDVFKNGCIYRPEEHIVKMYVDHYSTPKIIYNNTIRANQIKPIDAVFIPSLGKNLVIGEIAYNLKFNEAQTTLKEL